MTISKKVVPIKYTAKDFNSIKLELVEYAKKYYPDTFKDFGEASFGALMLDWTAYIGDILSFYSDYNANEAHLKTSIEFSNILKHARASNSKHSRRSVNFAHAAHAIACRARAFFFNCIEKPFFWNDPFFRAVKARLCQKR